MSRLCSRLPIPKSRVSLIVVWSPQRPTVLVVRLDLGALVVDMQRRVTPSVITRVRNRPGQVPRPFGPDAAVEDQPDPVGPAEVEVLADHLLEEHPARQRPVQHLRGRELRLQNGDVVAVAGLPVLWGELALANTGVSTGSSYRRPGRHQR